MAPGREDPKLLETKADAEASSGARSRRRSRRNVRRESSDSGPGAEGNSSVDLSRNKALEILGFKFTDLRSSRPFSGISVDMAKANKTSSDLIGPRLRAYGSFPRGPQTDFKNPAAAHFPRRFPPLPSMTNNSSLFVPPCIPPNLRCSPPAAGSREYLMHNWERSSGNYILPSLPSLLPSVGCTGNIFVPNDLMLPCWNPAPLIAPGSFVVLSYMPYQPWLPPYGMPDPLYSRSGSPLTFPSPVPSSVLPDPFSLQTPMNFLTYEWDNHVNSLSVPDSCFNPVSSELGLDDWLYRKGSSGECGRYEPYSQDDQPPPLSNDVGSEETSAVECSDDSEEVCCTCEEKHCYVLPDMDELEE